MTVDADDAAAFNEVDRLLEEAVDAVNSIAVAHLRIHYPAALTPVPETAQTSLHNAVRSAARTWFGRLVYLWTEAGIDLRHPGQA